MNPSARDPDDSQAPDEITEPATSSTRAEGGASSTHADGGASSTRADGGASSTGADGGSSSTGAVVAGRTARRPGRDYTSAVYGSVVAATVVVSSGDLRAPGTLAVLLVVSGVVFWFAHVYAATVAGVHGGWQLGSIVKGLRHEWPVAFAAIPPAIAALVCALLPNITVTDGVWAALVVAIVEQQLWGYAAVRYARLSGPALTRTLLLNVFVGMIIIALKFLVGH